MTKTLGLLLMSATMLATSGTAQAANLLTNGSFETPAITAAPWFIRSTTNTPGWVQTGDGVDLIHNNYEQPSLPVLVDASDGVQFLDMNQLGAIGGIRQTVAATVGTIYTLELDAAAWATNSRGGRVGFRLYDPTSLATLASGSFFDQTGGIWVRQSISAEATSSSIGVDIFGITAAQAGMGVDNVMLSAAVPEPATWAMMLMGFGLVGAGIRSRRKPTVSLTYA